MTQVDSSPSLSVRIPCPGSGSRSQGAAVAHALTSPSCPIIAPAPHPAAGFPASP